MEGFFLLVPNQHKNLKKKEENPNQAKPQRLAQLETKKLRLAIVLFSSRMKEEKIKGGLDLKISGVTENTNAM